MSPRTREGKRRERWSATLLEEVLERRVALYVMAAGAGLAIVPAAQAEVVFTPSTAQCVRYSGYDSYDSLQIDLNNDGTTDFTLSCSYARSGSNAAGSYLGMKGAVPSNVTLESTGGLPAALRRGAKIGSSARFGTYGLMAKNLIGYSIWTKGNFDGVSNRILGVRFQINGEAHYGWIGFRYAYASYATLVGWAYETIPNKPIYAGAKRGMNSNSDGDVDTNAAVMHLAEPTSLELLAAGDVAMPEWRRRRAG
jgi:hypothetical protein